jgi:hypothetical protein
MGAGSLAVFPAMVHSVLPGRKTGTVNQGWRNGFWKIFTAGRLSMAIMSLAVKIVFPVYPFGPLSKHAQAARHETAIPGASRDFLPFPNRILV